MRQLRTIANAAMLGIALLAFAACNDESAEWRATRDAVGAEEADAALAQETWRVYRESVVLSLREMETVLEGARGAASVVEQSQADDLVKRIEGLRRDMISDAGLPPEEATETRPGLRRRFGELRTEVDAFLRRLGYDSEQLARWQDVE